MSDLADALGRDTELEELRRALRSAQTQLSVYRRKSDEIRDALTAAARDAVLTMGPLPPVKPAKARQGSGSPEVALLHATDWQASKVTASYSSQVLRDRVDVLKHKVTRLTAIQRADHPVDECVVMFGGDMIEGLFNYPAQLWQIDASLFDQWASTAWLCADLIRHLLTVFGRVSVVAEWGNHGRIGSKRAEVPKNDNMDRMVYAHARALLAGEDRLDWPDCPGDVQQVEIGAYRALLIHGDEIGRTGFASPMTIVRHADRWRSGAWPWEFRDLYCVDTVTEALTPAGWKHFDSIGELPIATLNPDTSAFEWQVPQRIVSYEYSGPMVHHLGRSMDHFATVDHDMWVGHKRGPWGKRKSLDVPASLNWRYRAAADRWVGTVDFPAETPGRIRSGDLHDVAELIGWFVAEGCSWAPAGQPARQVIIAQSRTAKPDNHKRILELLRRLGYPNATSRPDAVRVCNTELAVWLRNECGYLAPNKHVPAWAKELPKPALLTLIEAACMGDGSAVKTGNGRGLTHYYTASQRLAEDMQEVALKAGLATGLTVRAPRGFGTLPSYQVALSAAPVRTMATTKTVTEWSGRVWCPTVPNGLWFMRRNGRVMVTGNCGHFHTHSEWAMANGEGTVFQTGSTESDNRYARDGMAASAVPSQRLHFVDPQAGRVTAQYKVILG
jgi:hypothetical protein